MKSDRKLLESAAKAAGYECAWSDSREGFYFGLGSYTPQYWNPLSNDGDALRLAVKLGLDLCVSPNFRLCAWSAVSSDWVEEPPGSDPCAAMRRAIVRAAAMAG